MTSIQALRGCPSEAEFWSAVREERCSIRFAATPPIASRRKFKNRNAASTASWCGPDATGTKEGERQARIDEPRLPRIRSQNDLRHRGANSNVQFDRGERASCRQFVGTADALFYLMRVRRPRRTTILPAEPSDRYLAAGLGPLVETGSAPSVTEGARLFGAVRSQSAVAGAGVQATLPVTLRQGDGTGFTSSSFGMTLAPCAHTRGFALCAVGAVGRARVEGFGIDDPRTPASATAQAGVRLALAHLLSPRLALAIYAEGLGNLTPQTVYLNDMPVWTPRTLSFALGIDASVSMTSQGGSRQSRVVANNHLLAGRI